MICRHFGQCGGCKLQDLDYKKQLRKKQDYLESIFLKENPGSRLNPIIASPRIFFYRNKMEFSFFQENSELICGLYHRIHKRSVVDVNECTIFSKETPLILSFIREYFKNQGLSAYNKFSHKGFLRHLVLREAKNSQDFMINLVTSSQGTLDKEDFSQGLLRLDLKKKISSLVWTINDSLSDAVIPQRWQVLHGDNYIEEKIEGFTFRIFPYSFFQINPYILETFYRTLREYLDLRGSEKILDLFCGIGTISLILANSSEFIWSVEHSQQAVENANINVSLNGIKNIAFLLGDVRKILYSNMQLFKSNIDAIIVNPSRSGLAKKVIQRIKEIRPRKIVYSSCNPKSFFGDIKGFLNSYNLEIIQPFDFFPQTPHVELLSLFTRK